MKSISLKYPIEIDGKTISELTFRRAKAKDMVVIGDHMPALSGAIDPADANNPAAIARSMTGETFKAMIAVVGQLADIGEEAAAELDFADLIPAVTEAMESLGEVGGSDGEAPTGE